MSPPDAASPPSASRQTTAADWRPFLAFDASGDACSALVRAAHGDTARSEPMARGQAERLIPLCEELLVESGATFGDLQAIGVCAGPGSFTGVRVAVAAARALALALDRPAVGAPAHEVLAAAAASAGLTGRVAVCLGRGAGTRWWGYQIADGGIARAFEDGRVGPVEGAGDPGPSWPALIGPAAAAIDPARATSGYDSVVPALLADRIEARLGALSPGGGRATAAPVRPLYLRPPDADPPRVGPPPRLGSDAGSA